MSTAEKFASTSDNPAGATVDRVARAAHDTVDRAANAAHAAADSVSAQTDRVKSAQRDAFEQAGNYVREKPLQACGMALAAGFVIGRLLKR